MALAEGELIGAAWGQRQPGSTAIFWPPQWTQAVDEDTACRLACAAGASTRRRRDPHDPSAAHRSSCSDRCQRLRRPGFARLADLALFELGNSADLPSRESARSRSSRTTRHNAPSLANLSREPTRAPRIAPRMNGKRPMAEVLDGYQATGTFSPENWLFVRADGADVGVLLVADHRAAKHWELMYMGVVPRARGAGLGGEIVRAPSPGATRRASSASCLPSMPKIFRQSRCTTKQDSPRGTGAPCSSASRDRILAANLNFQSTRRKISPRISKKFFWHRRRLHNQRFPRLVRLEARGVDNFFHAAFGTPLTRLLAGVKSSTRVIRGSTSASCSSESFWHGLTHGTAVASAFSLGCAVSPISGEWRFVARVLSRRQCPSDRGTRRRFAKAVRAHRKWSWTILTSQRTCGLTWPQRIGQDRYELWFGRQTEFRLDGDCLTVVDRRAPSRAIGCGEISWLNCVRVVRRPRGTRCVSNSWSTSRFRRHLA